MPLTTGLPGGPGPGALAPTATPSRRPCSRHAQMPSCHSSRNAKL